MKTMGKMIWATVGVGVSGVVIGVGLMVAGDFLGRRDEAALQGTIAAPTPAVSIPAQRALSSEPTASPMTQPLQETGMTSAEVLPALKLAGTMLADDPQDSTAVFEDLELRTRRTMRLGERIESWELAAIERASVLFKGPEDAEVTLMFEGDTLRDAVAAIGGREISDALARLRRETSMQANAVTQAAQAITVVSDQERVVDRQQLLQATGGNPLTLLIQAPLVPHFSGMQSGLRLTSTAEAPWVEKAGLEAGDVLTAVNGKAILDPRKMGAIASELLGSNDLDITIQRAGREVRLQYHMQASP